jgi:hypothetical protein
LAECERRIGEMTTTRPDGKIALDVPKPRERSERLHSTVALPVGAISYLESFHREALIRSVRAASVLIHSATRSTSGRFA